MFSSQDKRGMGSSRKYGRILIILIIISGGCLMAVINVSQNLLSLETHARIPINQEEEADGPTRNFYRPKDDGDYDPCDRKRVIIVGAGASGLTAAKRLITQQRAAPQSSSNPSCQNQPPIHVQIMEASSGFGGRVQKDTSGFSHDFYPPDLGASWVYDPARLALMAQNPSLDLSHKHVAPVTLPDFQAIKMVPNDDDASDIHELHPRSMDMHADDNHLWVNYTWYDFLHDHIVHPALIGNSKRQQHLVYNCPVDRIIQHKDDSILVGCGKREFLADHVLITVPLSILQDQQHAITFSPPLPRRFRRQIAQSKMWQGMKIFLEFTRKFYYDVFEWRPDDGEMDFWDYSMVYTNKRLSDRKQNILAGYYIGEPFQSRFLLPNQKQMSEKDMVQIVLDDLDQVFGRKRATRNFIKHKIVNWSANPFIRGIYSNQAVLRPKKLDNGDDDGPRRVGGPQQLWKRCKLVVAGEAFPVPPHHNGWVDGASLSGLHAAEMILRRLGYIESADDFSIPQDLWETAD
ncbi:amine oxidase [Seminavis robusta]|uniref:Amine oxidase n=1 Tax=Seminavis robusta TaxID=568900 RepID=A0A9N8E385_9STRA|nr:amine oxidase [Seminavis robusta]|eukprot:Sro458_g147010.1 amine oxidase (518) ;mRNA; f:9851-11404